MGQDLITVQEFAEKYRVDQSVVRRWIREGRINYELVGPRKMAIKRSEVLVPLVADIPPQEDDEPVL